MNIDEYKQKMFAIANRYDKRARGAKYIRQWETHPRIR